MEAVLQYRHSLPSDPIDVMGRPIYKGDHILYRGSIGEMVRAEVMEVRDSRVVVHPYQIATVDFDGFTGTLIRWDRAMIINGRG